jgi:hypothetical protein
MSVFICNICKAQFASMSNLNRHLSKDVLCVDKKTIHELIGKLESERQVINNSIIGGENNTYINIKIEINPANRLNTDYISPDKMKNLIEKYEDFSSEKSPEKLNLLLSDYIKDVMCDSQHPENHAVKYIKKKPPTYNCLVEDPDGNTVSVIKGLKDSCELLSDPILNTLKGKLRECLNQFRDDDSFDFSLYESAIRQLRQELNKQTVKKALSSVLQNDILNDIQMKLNVSCEQVRSKLNS